MPVESDRKVVCRLCRLANAAVPPEAAEVDAALLEIVCKQTVLQHEEPVADSLPSSAHALFESTVFPLSLEYDHAVVVRRTCLGLLAGMIGRSPFGDSVRCRGRGG